MNARVLPVPTEATVEALVESFKILAAASDNQLMLIHPDTPKPPAAILDAVTVVVLDEAYDNGADECSATEWLLPWAHERNAFWSIWSATPDVAQTRALCLMAMISNAPLVVIITEDKYFHTWTEAIGPEHVHGMHVVFGGVSGLTMVPS